MRRSLLALLLAALALAQGGCTLAELAAPDPLEARGSLREQLLEAESPHEPGPWHETWGARQSNAAVVFGRGSPASRSDDAPSFQGPDKTACAEPAVQPSGLELFGERGSGAAPDEEPLFGHHWKPTTLVSPQPPRRGDANRAADALEALQRARGTNIELPPPGPIPSPTPTPPSVGP